MNGSTTNPSPQNSQRRRDIQGLRGVAVALVVLYHSGLPLPGGFIGVDVFFVVSGFVITLMLLRELKASGTIDLARFYRRRARRLLPALALMIIVIAILSIAILGPLGQQQDALETGVGASLFVANFQLIAAPGGYFDGPADINPFLHTWSLSVEEQFYLFLPVVLSILWGLALRRKNRRGDHVVVGSVLAAIVAASFLFSYALTYAGGANQAASRTEAFYSSIPRVWEFGVGVLLALAAHRLARLSRTTSQTLGIAGILLVVGSAFAITDFTAFPGIAAVFPVVGTGMLLAAGANAAPVSTTRTLSSAPAVWVGDLSYSWYLWHWPMIVFARTLWPNLPAAAPLAAVVSLAPAILAYHYIEQPIRLGVRFPNANGLKTGATAIAGSLAALAILGISAQAIRDLPEVAELSYITRHHIDATSGCAATGIAIGEDCVRLADEARGSVYLLGDSNAGHFTEPMAEAAAQANFDFAIAIRSGCPPIEVGSLHSGFPKEHCSGFPRDAMDAILRDKPDVVVLAAASDIYIDRDLWQLIDPETNAVISDPAAKAELWERGLTSVLDELNGAGIEVRLINPIPHFYATPETVLLDDCPAIRLLTNAATCGAHAPRDQLVEQRSRAFQAELAATTTVPSATTIDFFDQLCPDERCAMYIDDRWLYRDGTHLSIDGSLELTDDFYELLTAAVLP